MKNTVKTLIQAPRRIRDGYRDGVAYLLAVGTMTVLSRPALADLPTIDPPTQGANEGFMKQMQGYAYDASIFLGLILACAAFFVVAKNTIGAYSEVQDGKGNWSAVGLNFGAGAMLVVFIIWAMTKAAAVLSQ
ncbi:MAG: TIGR03745 family integrating conjugative element membrane protein [Parahaliea sp.]